mgnify:CR=1 FL=1
MRKIKNMKLSGMLALAMAVVLLVGSLAYFTDRITTKATISTIGADITTDPDDPTYKDDLTAKWLAFNAAPKANFNPGDKVDLSYKLANTGELALDVRETFIITSSKPMSATPEFRLFNGATQDADTKAYTGNGVVVTEKKISDTVYKYTVASYVLSGSEETIGSNAKSGDKTYQLATPSRALPAPSITWSRPSSTLTAATPTGSPLSTVVPSRWATRLSPLSPLSRLPKPISHKAQQTSATVWPRLFLYPIGHIYQRKSPPALLTILFPYRYNLYCKVSF